MIPKKEDRRISLGYLDIEIETLIRQRQVIDDNLVRLQKEKQAWTLLGELDATS